MPSGELVARPLLFTSAVLVVMRTMRRSILIAVIFCGLASFGMSRQAPLQDILQQKPPAGVTADVWPQVRKFYETRAGSLAWIEGRRLQRAEQAIVVVRRAFEHGLKAADYDEPRLTSTLQQLKSAGSNMPDYERQLAELDVRIT